MKHWIITLTLAVVIGIISFNVTLHYVPVTEMSKAEERIAKIAGGENVIRHGTRPTSKYRTVVRPSPDQLYSACVYDLSDGPVRFSGSVPETYWSLSIFAHNSDNFFVVNDSQLDSKVYDYVLIKSGQSAPAGIPASRIITSPSETGIAVIRMFIDRDENLPEIDRVQHLGNCESLEI